MINIKNLSFSYNKHFNLSIDELVVKEGEIFTLIGPNGAGKTTLLNIIAMFEQPETGSIEIFGHDILDSVDRLSLRRKMSFIFSQPYLLNNTVYKNIYLPFKLRGIKDNQRVEQILSLFKIDCLRNVDTAALSHGQRHRVALARAFVTKPKLILLDEPFLSLDLSYKESLINELRNIIKKNKVTAIFVTQDQNEALSFSDTIAVMKDGRILQQGSPQDIFTKPASKEVADFVGIENLIDGTVIKKEDSLCFIKVAGTDNFLKAVSDCGLKDNVFVSIRPEEIIISRDSEIGKSSARNHFKAKITKAEPWRLKYRLGLDCGFNLTAFIARQSLEELGLDAGVEVFVYFKATAIHLIRR